MRNNIKNYLLSLRNISVFSEFLYSLQISDYHHITDALRKVSICLCFHAWKTYLITVFSPTCTQRAQSTLTTSCQCLCNVDYLPCEFWPVMNISSEWRINGGEDVICVAKNWRLIREREAERDLNLSRLQMSDSSLRAQDMGPPSMWRNYVLCQLGFFIWHDCLVQSNLP